MPDDPAGPPAADPKLGPVERFGLRIRQSPKWLARKSVDSLAGLGWFVTRPLVERFPSEKTKVANEGWRLLATFFNGLAIAASSGSVLPMLLQNKAVEPFNYFSDGLCLLTLGGFGLHLIA